MHLGLNLKWIFICLSVSFCAVVDSKIKRQAKPSSTTLKTYDCPKLALLLYDKSSKKMANSFHRQMNPTTQMANTFDRQINHTITLIKSILITKEEDDCVHVILVSNKKVHFKTIQEKVYAWDARFTASITMEFVRLKYPKSRRWMRDIYRPGSTFGLFLPEVIPYDAIIYMDTDMLLLRSIRDLWLEMRKFSSSALSSALIRLMPLRHIHIPVLHGTGLGAGVMLMNLTRMRERKWTEEVVMSAVPLLSKIRMGFEDFLNIYFHKFPEEVHLLSCDWNYWVHRCEVPCSEEDEGIKGGISILHGNSCSFVDKKTDHMFVSVYESFVNTDLTYNFELKDLVARIKTGMDVEKTKQPSPCADNVEFENLVLKRLRQKLKSHN